MPELAFLTISHELQHAIPQGLMIFTLFSSIPFLRLEYEKKKWTWNEAFVHLPQALQKRRQRSIMVPGRRVGSGNASREDYSGGINREWITEDAPIDVEAKPHGASRPGNWWLFHMDLYKSWWSFKRNHTSMLSADIIINISYQKPVSDEGTH